MTVGKRKRAGSELNNGSCTRRGFSRQTASYATILKFYVMIHNTSIYPMPIPKTIAKHQKPAIDLPSQVALSEAYILMVVRKNIWLPDYGTTRRLSSAHRFEPLAVGMDRL